jgi:hypothetical protein
MPVAYLHQRTHVLAMAEGATVPPLADYCFFRQERPGERPPSEAGAAMLALIRAKAFPTFALAFYDVLSAAGQGHDPPARLALVTSDAILLAPRQAPGGWSGFLIAEGTAQGQVREFHWPELLDPVWLAVPHASAGGGAVWAEEAAFLAIRPSPHIPDSP